MMARKNAGLGDRHQKIMAFLVEFQQANGYPPTIREIGESIGVKSTSLVDYYLDQLQELKYIDRDKRISRSIRVLKSIAKTEAQNPKWHEIKSAVGELINIPIKGLIAAGPLSPLPASGEDSYLDPDSTIEIAASLMPTREKNSDLFALEVRGNSMIDAMVNDGDIVIMKHAESANNGEMVAVLLEDTDETTLKYFYKEGSRVRLQPANPTMPPIYVDNPEHLRIQAKVVMVVRQYKL